MYGFCTTLRCFGRLSVPHRLATIQDWADSLTRLNQRIFRTVGVVVPLYQSGVRYKQDIKGDETQWWDACEVLNAGYADCKALAAYRAAELCMQGVPARAVVTTSNGVLFHVIVSANGRDEDPSRILGMKG